MADYCDTCGQELGRPDADKCTDPQHVATDVGMVEDELSALRGELQRLRALVLWLAWGRQGERRYRAVLADHEGT